MAGVEWAEIRPKGQTEAGWLGKDFIMNACGLWWLGRDLGALTQGVMRLGLRVLKQDCNCWE